MSENSAVQVATASSNETQPEQQGQATTQWAYRSQKATGLRSGSPSYSPVTGFENLQSIASVFEYAPDGSIFAAALADCVRIVDSSAASTCSVKHDLQVPKVVALEFSPSGGYLSTWERPSKLEDGTNVKNLKIWNVQTGQEVASFERKSREGCFFQFTSNEKYCIRQVSTELQVYEASSISESGVVGRLRLEGMTSFEVGPGEKPSVAVFFGEKKGAPAAVRVYSLASFVPSPENPPAAVSQKQFFKADKIQIKWNKAGTGLLFRTSTDVDKSNKSYDGESNLYMMSSRGDFDCRVGLDKEGPIHDFEWNPNSREFIVLFGFMPAKAVLFSYKVNVIKELGTGPRNFIAFNPQGRLFAIAGFGNLSGTVDIWDREKLDKGKITSMDASNSSVFQWSPDGHFILTGTLSPRLRVENGVRIWHCTGKLVHVEMIDELYQASWRPGLNTSLVAFPSTLPEAPAPSPTAAEYLATHKSVSSKPTGAYRPPGARGLATPDIYKREDRDASSAPPSPSPGGARNRSVPGAPNGKSVPGAPRRTVPGAGGATSSPNNKKTAPPGAPPASNSNSTGKKSSKKSNGQVVEAAPVVEETPVLPVSGAAEVGGNAASIANEKKVRNLNKKLKAIAELKEKQAKGEKLEQTQISKINSEKEIRAELETLE